MTFVAEFIAGAVTEFFHVTPQRRLIDFPGVPDGFDHVVRFKGVALSFRRNGKVCRRKVRVNMRIKRARCIVLKARGTEDSGCSPPFVPLLVSPLNARERFERFVSLGHSGVMRLKEAVITAQFCHDRDRLLRRPLEVVTDDVGLALLQLFSTGCVTGEDAQKSRVLWLD